MLYDFSCRNSMPQMHFFPQVVVFKTRRCVAFARWAWSAAMPKICFPCCASWRVHPIPRRIGGLKKPSEGPLFGCFFQDFCWHVWTRFFQILKYFCEWLGFVFPSFNSTRTDRTVESCLRFVAAGPLGSRIPGEPQVARKGDQLGTKHKNQKT